MFFRVRHITTYRYSRPVRLRHCWRRPRPRSDGCSRGDAQPNRHAEVHIDVDQ